MRITFNPSIMNTSPVKPVHGVVRRKPSLVSEPAEPEPAGIPPVITAMSEFATQRSQKETDEGKEYKKRNPLWNTMLNL
ncbi:MAG: hypothetical protein WCO61_12080 [Alphaproteobacteria bacterium]